MPAKIGSPGTAGDGGIAAAAAVSEPCSRSIETTCGTVAAADR
jgi:hypothetical protein